MSTSLLPTPITRRVIRREQHILATGSWVAPAALLVGTVVATVINGGNSGTVRLGTEGGVGGNGGGAVRRRMSDVTPGSTQPVVIGSGGVQSATAGGSPSVVGSQSRFGSVFGPTVSATVNSGNPSRVPSTADEGGGQAISYSYSEPPPSGALDGAFPPYGGAGASVHGNGLQGHMPGRGGGAGGNEAPAGNAQPNSGGGGATATVGSPPGSGGSGRVIVEWEEYAA